MYVRTLPHTDNAHTKLRLKRLKTTKTPHRHQEHQLSTQVNPRSQIKVYIKWNMLLE